MAMIKGPRGKMTRPLVTEYEVGDVVLLTGEQESYEDQNADDVPGAPEAWAVHEQIAR